MNWFRFAILILVATVLQAEFIDVIAIKDVTPDLLLILLVFFAVYCDTTEAIIASFSIGFAADLIGPVMGAGLISFGIFGTLLAYLHRVIAIRKMSHQSLVIFIVSLLSGLLIHFLAFLKKQPLSTNMIAVLFGASLYSGLVGPFLFLPSAWWMRIKTNQFSKY